MTAPREFIARHFGEAVPDDLLQAPQIFHLDGRLYTVDEWPLVRSISTGEHVVDRPGTSASTAP